MTFWLIMYGLMATTALICLVWTDEAPTGGGALVQMVLAILWPATLVVAATIVVKAIADS